MDNCTLPHFFHVINVFPAGLSEYVEAHFEESAGGELAVSYFYDRFPPETSTIVIGVSRTQQREALLFKSETEAIELISWESTSEESEGITMKIGAMTSANILWIKEIRPRCWVTTGEVAEGELITSSEKYKTQEAKTEGNSATYRWVSRIELEYKLKEIILSCLRNRTACADGLITISANGDPGPTVVVHVRNIEQALISKILHGGKIDNREQLMEGTGCWRKKHVPEYYWAMLLKSQEITHYLQSLIEQLRSAGYEPAEDAELSRSIWRFLQYCLVEKYEIRDLPPQQGELFEAECIFEKITQFSDLSESAIVMGLETDPHSPTILAYWLVGGHAEAREKFYTELGSYIEPYGVNILHLLINSHQQSDSHSGSAHSERRSENYQELLKKFIQQPNLFLPF